VYQVGNNKKVPVLTSRAPVILMKVECNAFLCMFLVSVSIYIKTVLRYKFLFLDIYHPDI